MIKNFNKIDTTPGAEGENSMFSPSATFTGGRKEYMAFLKNYREVDLICAVWCYMRSAGGAEPEVLGPYAEPFLDAFRRVCQRRRVAESIAAQGALRR